MLQVTARYLNISSIKLYISVIMVKNTQIIRIQSMIMPGLPLVISKTKLLLLVHGQSKTQKLKYLISTQIYGRRKLPFLTVQNSEFILGWNLCVTRFKYILLWSYQSQIISTNYWRCDSIGSALVAKYTIDQWERVGNLQKSRAYHRAIADDNRIYVVGGFGIL